MELATKCVTLLSVFCCVQREFFVVPCGLVRCRASELHLDTWFHASNHYSLGIFPSLMLIMWFIQAERACRVTVSIQFISPII